MYPVFKDVFEASSDTPFFILQPRVETWKTGDKKNPQYAGSLRLFNVEDEIGEAIVHTLNPNPVDLEPVLRDLARATEPWVETMAAVHPLFRINNQQYDLKMLLEAEPDDLENPAEMGPEAFSYATDPEISTALSSVPGVSGSHVELTAEWILGCIPEPDAEMRKYLHRAVRPIVKRLTDIVTDRLIDQHMARTEKIFRTLPADRSLPEFDPAWQIIRPLGYGIHRTNRWAR